jgi:putative Ca2+/H+ antiporter (TMEM165/GDT1 family)
LAALIPALIAVLLAEMGSKVQGLAHAATAKSGAGAILAALALTSAIGLGVAAAGGIYVSKMLTPDARTLLAALALAFAGVPMLLPRRKPVTSPKHLIPAFVVAQFGDSAQFIVFAIAAQGGEGALAAAGGVFGMLAATSPPVLLGDQWPGRVPLGTLRWIAAALLIVAAIWLAAQALQLT